MRNRNGFEIVLFQKFSIRCEPFVFFLFDLFGTMFLLSMTTRATRRALKRRHEEYLLVMEKREALVYPFWWIEPKAMKHHDGEFQHISGEFMCCFTLQTHLRVLILWFYCILAIWFGFRVVSYLFLATEVFCDPPIDFYVAFFHFS